MTLPRLHAITDGWVLRRPDFEARVTALAALGPRVAIHVRDRSVSGRALWQAAERVSSVASPHGALVLVNARPDIAAGLAAFGVQLGAGDLGVLDARRVAPRATIGRSVHSLVEAAAAAADGADFLVAGSIFATESHPGAGATGTGFVRSAATLGRPVVAIGGITAERAPAVHAAGAHGIAAMRALWDAPDAVAAAEALLAPWREAA